MFNLFKKKEPEIKVIDSPDLPPEQGGFQVVSIEIDPEAKGIQYKGELVSLREYILIVINDEFKKKMSKRG